jgi:hypothetical protein
MEATASKPVTPTQVPQAATPPPKKGFFDKLLKR